MFFSHSGELTISVDKVSCFLLRVEFQTDFPTCFFQSTLFLYPSVYGNDPADDTILTGNIKLILTKPTIVDSLKIKLDGKSTYTAGGNSIFEEEIWLKEELNWAGEGEEFKVGEYNYSFSFIIPSNSPEYQRCKYGRSNVFLSSTLFVGNTGFIKKSNIVSRPLQITLLGNLAVRGELPDPYNELLTGFNESVGVS